MLRAVEYIADRGGAVVYRCYGDGAFPQIPENVDDLPVIALADHCFAPEPSFRLKNRQRKMARQCADGAFLFGRVYGAEEAGEDYPEMCGQSVQEIFLPEGLRSIGDYAFYGCRNLKCIHVPSTLQNVGGGCFVDVHQLKEIVFTVRGPETGEACEEHARWGNRAVDSAKKGAESFNIFPRSIKAMIVDIPDETEAVVCDAHGKELYRLVFPGYYEESLENTPARIIQVVYQGMGFKYRQCLKDGAVDIRRYDALFYETSVQELPETVMALAFDRLAMVGQRQPEETPDFLAPVRPSPEAADLYLTYLRDAASRVCQTIVSGQQTDRLEILCRLPYFDQERLSLFLDEASRAGWAQGVSALMEYRREHFRPEREHKYEL